MNNAFKHSSFVIKIAGLQGSSSKSTILTHPDAVDQNIHCQLVKNKLYLEILDLIRNDGSFDRPEMDLSRAFLSFHVRKDQLKRFRSGDLVGIDSDSKLVSDNVAGIRPAAFLVVCDDSQKKLARYIPFQALGHWCTAVGVARVRVDGTVVPGDLIRPKGDGSGLATVALGWNEGPVGFALQSSPAQTGSVSAANGSSGALVSILISQNPSADLRVVAGEGAPTECSGPAKAKAEASALVEMLERYVSLASAGDPVACPHPAATPVL